MPQNSHGICCQMPLSKVIDMKKGIRLQTFFFLNKIKYGNKNAGLHSFMLPS